MILTLIACRGFDIIEVENPEDLITEEIINVEDLHTHLDALQQIADDNSNNRAAGTPGSDASMAYVEEILTSHGYTVWTQDVELEYYQENSDPYFMVNGNQEFEVSGFYYSPKGEVTAAIQAVDLMIPPGSQANSSDSGCEESDFENFTAGNIALIQRGTCQFTEKARNAQDAGAVGVIIFNEGQNGRRDVVFGTLDDEQLTIPVMGTSYDWGVDLSEREGQSLTMSVDSEIVELMTKNVFAEREIGDENNIVLIGGHLDSVYAGPGINDNGTGTSALLSLAQKFSSENFESTNRIRFAFWGAEELGLIGSTHYVENASQSELNKILANLNFDMLGSPNYVRFIYDGDGSDGPEAGPTGSDVIEEMFEDHFRVNELPFSSTSFDGRSDYGPFIAVGIPAGGLFSGAEGVKTTDEKLIFEGESGIEYDKCYHLECDSRENVNDKGFEEMYAAVVSVTKLMANIENFRNRRPIKDLQEEKKKFMYWGDILQY
jgi:Zn-dependent M28 family amino/carboxypeptidase